MWVGYVCVYVGYVVICPGDSAGACGDIPTERFYSGVFCRALKLTSRFFAFKLFQLPTSRPSIQLDITYLATFISH